MDAKTYSERHSKLRLAQRYGLRLSVEQLRKAVATIQMGQAVPLKRQTNSRTLFAVQLGRDERWVPVVYSRSRKAIVTVLPEKVLRRHLARTELPGTTRNMTPAATGAGNDGGRKSADIQVQVHLPETDPPAEPLFRLEQDKHIDRFNMVPTDLKYKPKTELYFREVLGRKCMTYARSKRLCAAGKEKILGMFKQQLGDWFPGARENLESELKRIGLEW